MKRRAAAAATEQRELAIIRPLLLLACDGAARALRMVLVADGGLGSSGDSSAVAVQYNGYSHTYVIEKEWKLVHSVTVPRKNDDVFHQTCWSGLLQWIPDGVQKGVQAV